jgi:formate C-acetyltransferase
MDKNRIELLRERCLQRKLQDWIDISVSRAAALQQIEHITSWQERQGYCTRRVLSEAVFEIDDLELLAGRLAVHQYNATDKALADARDFLELYPPAPGQTGHCELDLSSALKLGIDGLCKDIKVRLRTTDEESAATYRSFLLVLQGLTVFIQRAAESVRAQMSTATPDRRAELDRIAKVCEWIAHMPPRSFEDAIQLQWFIILAVQYSESVALVAPGHLDRTLKSFYEADRATGRLCREEALFLIESLYLLINEFIPDGLAIPVMVGGRDAFGNDVTNEISYLCLEALRRTKLVYPTVGICWHEGTPDELVDLAIDLISNGYSNPAFFGDETIRHGLEGYGVPREEACNYMNSTCVEITPSGASNVWVASPYYNTCAILLQEIDEVKERQPASFAEFFNGYQKRLVLNVESKVVLQNKARKEREQFGRKPLQSVFTRNCIERGKDIDCGGATYNWVECSFVGLANLADSLFVIREEVFNAKRISLRKLHELLACDFEGCENIRQRFMNAYPKYGQGSSDVDDFLSEIVSSLIEICKPFKMYPDDSPYVPGAFVWIMHERLGQETGATPDGRKAGMPFADGAGPAQGRETKGPTAAILSTTSWDHSPFIGGVAFNMKFSASLFDGTPKAANTLRHLVFAFLRRGGFETQINVIDNKVLESARENPEAYRDLVVRIGGYTDYFTRLSPAMQDEIMLRTVYESV